MNELAKEIMEEIEAFIEDNKYEVMARIKETDHYKNIAEYTEYDPDSFELFDFYPVKDHLCEVIAEVTSIEGYTEGYTSYCNGDFYPNERSFKERIRFFVDKDEEGNYMIAYPLNEKGETDFNAVLLGPDDPSDYDPD